MAMLLYYNDVAHVDSNGRVSKGKLQAGYIYQLLIIMMMTTFRAATSLRRSIRNEQAEYDHGTTMNISGND